MTRPFFLLPAFLMLGACTQQQASVESRSLEASGDVTFVCVEGDGTPHDLDDCQGGANEKVELFALVTQTRRGEVAVVRPFSEGVLDVEPSVPGQGFLAVGAEPGDIVSTPGSAASFVGVAEVGREGIFALPSSCIVARGEGDSPRDLTAWPACRLPSAPGDMVVLVDPPGEDGSVRTSCDGSEAPGQPSADAGARECPADLTREEGPPGRRKLAVTLPDRAEIWVLDAQRLLDRQPGSFAPCEFEHRIPLHANLPELPVVQRPPDDLDFQGCLPPALDPNASTSRAPEDVTSRPAGLAFDAVRQRLFVADREAPVVHVIDASDPCNLRERLPLLPRSFSQPERVVTTRKVAVSPQTTDGKQYVYAIDDGDRGGVMVFDVSADSSNRTPLLRPNSDLIPFEPPDRILFDAPAQDVAFVRRDVIATDPTRGNVVEGVLCDPAADPESPAGQHQPASDFTRGANPGTLRGIFAFVALDNARVAIVDVQDFDAPCRRPRFKNPDDIEDFRGCSGDMGDGVFTRSGTEGDDPTVTDEVSCNVVSPHRTRSVSLIRNETDFGVNRAPSLRSFPRLTDERGRTLPTNQTEEGRQQPMMLAVDFSPTEAAAVYVGSDLLVREAAGASELVIDPARAENSSLSLSFVEPRAYSQPAEQFSATFEGVIIGERTGRLEPTMEPTQLRLVDNGVSFCDLGVHDLDLARDTAQDLLVEEPALDRFARGHADFITITSDIPDEDNVYWEEGNAGAQCGLTDQSAQPGQGFFNCRSRFGPPDAPTDLRELRIVEAERNRLIVEPKARGARQYTSQQKQFVNDLLACCFPVPVTYTVRAADQWVVFGNQSGFQHRVMTNENGECVRDCSPLRAKLNSRAFEVTCRGDDCFDEEGTSIIGEATDRDVACVVSDPSTELKVYGEGGACVFSNLTHRFVIYRGLTPSVRGMQFSWEVTGGFSQLDVDLAARESASTVPQALVYIPQADRLALTDAATKGLVLISPANFSIVPFF